MCASSLGETTEVTQTNIFFSKNFFRQIFLSSIFFVFKFFLSSENFFFIFFSKIFVSKFFVLKFFVLFCCQPCFVKIATVVPGRQAAGWLGESGGCWRHCWHCEVRCCLRTRRRQALRKAGQLVRWATGSQVALSSGAPRHFTK